MFTWTTADLAALDAAIATGATKVRFADNREVTYRSQAEMWALRRVMVDAITGSGANVSRSTIIEHSRD